MKPEGATDVDTVPDSLSARVYRPEPDGKDERILILMPSGRDAALAADAIQDAGLQVMVTTTMDELTRALTEGAGVVLISQEALTPPELESLSRTLSRQPPWSDLPLIVLTGTGRATEAGEVVLAAMDRLGNATFLERPLRVATLIRAIKVALRTRRRQYEIRGYLQDRERAAAERVALIEQQRRFLRDVLASVTEGKLRLCDTPNDLPELLPPHAPPITLTRESLRRLRREMLRVGRACGFEEERADDLVTAANEAAMNAAVHGGGGIAYIGAGTSAKADAGTRTIQVWVTDHGSGIDVASLPRATLERGYSSAGTFGHGFWLILKAADRTYLLTGPTGTTVVLEQDSRKPKPIWMRGT